MFTGEWDNTRTKKQKREDRLSERPKQMSMFSLRDTISLGVSARPWLKEAPRPTIQLENQDVKTPEEVERDLRREAEAQTEPMFEIDTG